MVLMAVFPIILKDALKQVAGHWRYCIRGRHGDDRRGRGRRKAVPTGAYHESRSGCDRCYEIYGNERFQTFTTCLCSSSRQIVSITSQAIHPHRRCWGWTCLSRKLPNAVLNDIQHFRAQWQARLAEVGGWSWKFFLWKFTVPGHS